jgi:hypothetical protein
MVVAKEHTGGSGMKKLIAIFISLLILSMTALPAAAQTRTRCANQQNVSTNDGRYRDARYRSRYDETVYRDENVYSDDNVYTNDDGYYGYGDNRSIWEKSRDKITTAGGAVGGAVLGGLIGGKKGAIIGAITGGAGAAIYTYKIRDKVTRY